MAENFNAFMKATEIDTEEISYVASSRFTDESGNPIPWKFHLLTASENEKLILSATKKFVGATGKKETTTDNVRYMKALCAKCVTYPNLNDAELQAHYGAIGAEQLISKMLLPGEFTNLFNAIIQALGFENDMADKIETAKN